MLDVAIPPFAAAPVTPLAHAGPHVSFHDVLSALNPLQYLPVIGTIYRAVTGDQIPEALRRIGSVIVGGLLGGPIGAGISIASIAAEKITGIDLDKTGQALIAGGNAAEPPVATIAPPASAPPIPAPERTGRQGPQAPQDLGATAAWSPAQLAAYGVATAVDGTLTLGAVSGADVLNTLELSRIAPRVQVVQSAYDRTASLIN